MKKRTILGLIGVIFVVGCSLSPKLRQEIMDSQYDEEYAALARINSVGYALLKTLPDNGGSKVAYLPFSWTAIGDTYSEYFGQNFGSEGREPVFLEALSGVTPSQLDLRRGDQIAFFDGKEVKNAAQLRKYLKNLGQKDSVRIGFERGGAILSYDVPILYFNSEFHFGLVTKVPSYYSEYYEKDRAVLISESLFELTHADNELAYILAHGLVHAINGHKHRQVVDKTHQFEDVVMYGVITTALMPRYKPAPFDREIEQQADREAQNMMSAAGYSSQGRQQIINKLNQYSDEKINLWSSIHTK